MGLVMNKISAPLIQYVNNYASVSIWVRDVKFKGALTLSTTEGHKISSSQWDRPFIESSFNFNLANGKYVASLTKLDGFALSSFVSTMPFTIDKCRPNISVKQGEWFRCHDTASLLTV